MLSHLIWLTLIILVSMMTTTMKELVITLYLVTQLMPNSEIGKDLSLKTLKIYLTTTLSWDNTKDPLCLLSKLCLLTWCKELLVSLTLNQKPGKTILENVNVKKPESLFLSTGVEVVQLNAKDQLDYLMMPLTRQLLEESEFHKKKELKKSVMALKWPLKIPIILKFWSNKN